MPSTNKFTSFSGYLILGGLVEQTSNQYISHMKQFWQHFKNLMIAIGIKLGYVKQKAGQIFSVYSGFLIFLVQNGYLMYNASQGCFTHYITAALLQITKLI